MPPRRTPESRTFVCPECNSQTVRISFRRPENIRCTRCGHRGVNQIGATLSVEPETLRYSGSEWTAAPIDTICVLCSRVWITKSQFNCTVGRSPRTPDEHIYNFIIDRTDKNKCEGFVYEISHLRRMEAWGSYLVYQQAQIEAKLTVPDKVPLGVQRTIRF
jgi:DNA-directed RNA polymerase subunit RPC12/RpoP